MNIKELKHCLDFTENFCASDGLNINDAKVSIMNFQKGANAPLEQKLRVEVNSFSDIDFAIEVAPKSGVE